MGGTVLATRIDPTGAPFQENAAAFDGLLAALAEQQALARGGGGPKAVDRHHSRGGLLAHERIDLLLDEDAPFLGCSTGAAYGMRLHGGAGRVSGVVVGGPPLVKMHTGEDADDESLGGAEMHARVSGLADYMADDEIDCIRIGRQIVADLGFPKLGRGPDRPVEEPVHDPEELLGIVS